MIEEYISSQREETPIFHQTIVIDGTARQY